MILSSKTIALSVICCVSLCLQTGCSSSKALNKKSDYKITTTHLKNADYSMALKTYPRKEQSGFITLTEKSWIRLLDGKPSSLKDIQRMGDQLPEKETTFLSKEARHFFYQRTAEGYFPAEHEVIVFHLISAMSLLRQNNRDAAFVEARRAAFYLQDDFVSHAGAFDDPFLRVWLASVWVALDEWNSAQVDLRKAAELSNRYQWAAQLARRESAPKRWMLAFQGTGPEIEWDPDGFHQLWTGKGSLQFQLFEHTRMTMQLGDVEAETFVAHGMDDIYKRHQQRNAEIREALETSDYMLKSSSLHVGAGAAKGMAKMANATFKIVGLAVGGAIIAGTLYLLSQSSSSDGAGEVGALGIALGVGSFQLFSDTGSDIDTGVSKSVDKSLDDALDISKTYRFVRFIPDTLMLGTSEDTDSKVRLKVSSEDIEREPFLTAKTKQGLVEFYFQPL